MQTKPIGGADLLPRPDDLPPNPTADQVRAAITADNERAHLAFLKAERCLDRSGVVKAAGFPTEAHSPGYPMLAEWERKRHIFSVPRDGRDLYPAFQLKDGRPHRTIGDVLAVLPRHWTRWQIAFWFVSPTGWLDGDDPAKRLDDRRAVVDAARHEAEQIEG